MVSSEPFRVSVLTCVFVILDCWWCFGGLFGGILGPYKHTPTQKARFQFDLFGGFSFFCPFQLKLFGLCLVFPVFPWEVWWVFYLVCYVC